MSDAKGPYKTEEFKEAWTVRGPGGNTPFTNSEDADVYRGELNAAYAEGRKAGRASRDGIRNALELALRYMEKRGGCSCVDGSCPVCVAQKALEADGEGDNDHRR